MFELLFQTGAEFLDGLCLVSFRLELGVEPEFFHQLYYIRKLKCEASFIKELTGYAEKKGQEKGDRQEKGD
ncbi:MAG: hypothetical protein KAU46_05600, partial [Candidatus Aminicenantes bacterium]|nr:hypothetical protein [Candidatus Aminicenantes bacterium]